MREPMGAKHIDPLPLPLPLALARATAVDVAAAAKVQEQADGSGSIRRSHPTGGSGDNAAVCQPSRPVAPAAPGTWR
jgi:hypothetical protein